VCVCPLVRCTYIFICRDEKSPEGIEYPLVVEVCEAFNPQKLEDDILTIVFGQGIFMLFEHKYFKVFFNNFEYKF